MPRAPPWSRAGRTRAPRWSIGTPGQVAWWGLAGRQCGHRGGVADGGVGDRRCIHARSLSASAPGLRQGGNAGRCLEDRRPQLPRPGPARHGLCGRLHRRQLVAPPGGHAVGTGALGARAGRSAGHRLCHRCHRLLPGHPGLGAGRGYEHSRRPASHLTGRAPAGAEPPCRPRAHRSVSPPRRLDRREPSPRLEPAPGRHLRHRRAGGAHAHPRRPHRGSSYHPTSSAP